MVNVFLPYIRLTEVFNLHVVSYISIFPVNCFYAKKKVQDWINGYSYIFLILC